MNEDEFALKLKLTENQYRFYEWLIEHTFDEVALLVVEQFKDKLESDVVTIQVMGGVEYFVVSDANNVIKSAEPLDRLKEELWSLNDSFSI